MERVLILSRFQYQGWKRNYSSTVMEAKVVDWIFFPVGRLQQVKIFRCLQLTNIERCKAEQSKRVARIGHGQV